MADNGGISDLNAVAKASTRKIILKTSDGEVFQVDEPVAMQFLTVKSFFDDGGVSYDTVVPLPNVTERALSKVIEYCTRALEFGAKSAAAAGEKDAEKRVKEEREGFEAEYVKELSSEELKELVLAANYLNIKNMLDFLIQSVANRIQNKSVEYVRQFFGIENDYTPQEEERVRLENLWAFEGVDAD